jgi:hypothetical protein
MVHFRVSTISVCALPRAARTTVSTMLLASLACLASCSGGDFFCRKQAQCLAEEGFPELEDDSVGVCVVQYNGSIAALRANEEPECHVLADAILAVDACRAGLDCNDFFEQDDFSEACDNVLDDLDDALDDVDDGRCTAQES